MAPLPLKKLWYLSPTWVGIGMSMVKFDFGMLLTGKNLLGKKSPWTTVSWKTVSNDIGLFIMYKIVYFHSQWYT